VALNAGRLPDGYFAMAEQIVGRPEADVVALESDSDSGLSPDGGGLATEVRPPTTFVLAAEEDRYARKVSHLAIHHGLGRVVAIIEIVSPGNKNSRHALRSFADKVVELIQEGVNLLVIDLFPPGPRDPRGIHPLVWDEISEQPFELPPGKPPLPPAGAPQAQGVTTQGVMPAPKPADKPLTGPITTPKAAKKP